MKTAIIGILAMVFLAMLSGCSEKPKPLPFVIQSEGVFIESSDRDSSIEVSQIMRLTAVEPVQYDELDCTKGASHIKVKKKGSLQASFDNLVNKGWDCVLILD